MIRVSPGAMAHGVWRVHSGIHASCCEACCRRGGGDDDDRAPGRFVQGKRSECRLTSSIFYSPDNVSMNVPSPPTTLSLLTAIPNDISDCISRIRILRLFHVAGHAFRPPCSKLVFVESNDFIAFVNDGNFQRKNGAPTKWRTIYNLPDEDRDEKFSTWKFRSKR